MSFRTLVSWYAMDFRAYLLLLLLLLLYCYPEYVQCIQSSGMFISSIGSEKLEFHV